MTKSWLSELTRPVANEVHNKLNEIHDRVKDVPGYEDDAEKLYDFMAAESHLAVQRAQVILRRMVEAGRNAEWAGQALAFLQRHVPKRYLLVVDPRQKADPGKEK